MRRTGLELALALIGTFVSFILLLQFIMVFQATYRLADLVGKSSNTTAYYLAAIGFQTLLAIAATAIGLFGTRIHNSKTRQKLVFISFAVLVLITLIGSPLTTFKIMQSVYSLSNVF